MSLTLYNWESTQLESPLVLKCIETIKNCLANGELRPRESLVVKDLSERFGVKPSTVRQALDILVRHGFVVKRRNNTAVIRDFSIEELKQYYDVWKMLINEGIRLIEFPVQPGLIERLKKLADAHSSAIEDKDRTSFRHFNIEFHRTMFEACGNQVLLDMYIHVLWILQFFKSYRVSSYQRLKRAVENHQQMIEALVTEDRDTLLKISLEHQSNPEQWAQEIQHWNEDKACSEKTYS